MCRGSTPLHALCEYYREYDKPLMDMVGKCEVYGEGVQLLVDMVELMVEKGADVNAQDNCRRTPFDILRERHPKAFKLLTNK